MKIHLSTTIVLMAAAGMGAAQGLQVPQGGVTPVMVYGESSYFTVAFKGLPAGLDLSDGQYQGWCVDQFAHARLSGQQYGVYDTNGPLPANDLNANWPLVNWVLNHKPQPASTAATVDVEQVLWLLVNGTWNPAFAHTEAADRLYARALAEGAGFVPKQGQVAAVLLDPSGLGAQNREIQAVAIEVPVPLNCSTAAAISSSGSEAAPAQSAYLWFNSRLRAVGAGGKPITVTFRNQSIRFKAGAVDYTLAVPDAHITFSETAACASTVFDTATQTWLTTIAARSADEVFASGLALPVPAGMGAPVGPVTWQGALSTDTPGVSFEWRWAMAAYDEFSMDYNALGVSPMAGNRCGYSPWHTPGTPERFRKRAPGSDRAARGNAPGVGTMVMEAVPVCRNGGSVTTLP